MLKKKPTHTHKYHYNKLQHIYSVHSKSKIIHIIIKSINSYHSPRDVKYTSGKMQNICTLFFIILYSVETINRQ